MSFSYGGWVGTICFSRMTGEFALGVAIIGRMDGSKCRSHSKGGL